MTQGSEITQEACVSRWVGTKKRLTNLRKPDKAFDELTKGFEARDWELYRSNVEPYMRPLRNDPRFTVLVKRPNLPE